MSIVDKVNCKIRIRGMKQTELIRRFNRTYTSDLHLLDSHVLQTQWTFPEGRIIGAIGRTPGILARELCSLENMDKGYLSRILHGLEDKGLLYAEKDKEDGRAKHLYLSEEGKKAYEELEQRSDTQAKDLYAGFTREEMKQITDAMKLYLGKKEAKDVQDR